MKAHTFLLTCLITVFCFSCSNGKSATSVETEDTCQSVIADCFEIGISDTIININPRLSHLMDTLYQYIHQEYTDNDLKNNIKWMSNYRNRFCDYYRETRHMDGISDLAMADSIISEANILWEVHKDDSTIGMIVSNNTKLARLIFQQYNEFEKLNRLCSTEEQKVMLRTEFAEWIKLENLLFEIFTNCVELNYWGGTISGPIRTGGALEILQVHIDLYRLEYSILTNSGEDRDEYGTFLIPAQDLLISCSRQAFIDSYYSDLTDVRYKELYRETKPLINKLPEQIDAWCKSRQTWGNEMCTDRLRPAYQRNTSEVLIRLAHIISSI